MNNNDYTALAFKPTVPTEQQESQKQQEQLEQEQPTSNMLVSEEYVFVKQWGTNGTGDGQFNTPTDITIDSEGNVYVVDRVNQRIQKFDSNGNFITKWGSKGNGPGQFDYPKGIAVDSEGNGYVSETRTHDIIGNRIQKFDSNGNFIKQWSFENSKGGDQWNIAIDSLNNVYVTDTEKDNIWKFDNNGNFITKWGSRGNDTGQFDNPLGLAVDPKTNNVYVADSDNHRIQVFAPSSNSTSGFN